MIATIEQLVGLQAQAPFPPYYGLWSRLGGFRPDDLATLITDRSVVRIAVMRGTIHLVSARDCLPLRRLVQPVLDRGLRGSFGKQLAGVDSAAVAAAGRELVEAEPLTFTFHDEQGTELFDLPSAPRPDDDVPAPVRLAAEFDNLLLSHADRSRVVHPGHLQRFYTINGVFPGSVLIDGFVAGMWRLARAKQAATLTIELFGSARARRRGRPGQQRADVRREAERMLTFCAPAATHDIRFAPIT
ncbi:MAG: winged helix DNA-binding domain-containing protein [Streptosporangiaceae bacterium]